MRPTASRLLKAKKSRASTAFGGGAHQMGRVAIRTHAMDLLKLVAMDTDDIEVMSAHVQDSVVRVGDILWRPAEKRAIVVHHRVVLVGTTSMQQPYHKPRTACRVGHA